MLDKYDFEIAKRIYTGYPIIHLASPGMFRFKRCRKMYGYNCLIRLRDHGIIANLEAPELTATGYLWVLNNL